MARLAALMLVLVLSGCGGSDAAPSTDDPRRYADYDGTSEPAADDQCDVPVEERADGWFCPQAR